jgi:hypothetical protein
MMVAADLPGDRSETFFVNRSSSDTDSTSNARTSSTIVAKEIMA